VLYPTVKNTRTGRIAFPALDALREGYDVYPIVDAIAGTSVEAHRAGLERRAVLVGLSALVLASDVIGGIAPGIGVMLAARAVLGVGVVGFWVFGAGAAITLVSERARGTAMAVVSAGIFIATVASVPVASLIGTLTTWRVAFADVFAVIAVVAQLAAGSAVGGIVYDATGPGDDQLSASRLRRSGPRGGPGSAGPVARRDRWSRRGRTTNTLKLPFAAIPRPRPGRKGTAMPNAVVMTGYGPPEVLKWAGVPLREPGEGQIRIKVKAAGISPTDLALRAGYVKEVFPLPPNAVLGFEAAGTVDAVGPGVTGMSIGDGVTALLLGLGGYAEYALASIWTRKPDTVSWIDAAALPSSAEAAVGVLRQLNVKSGETLLLFGGGGSVGIIATQLAVARGIKVISTVGEQDETLARELGAMPVRYGAGVAGRVRALGVVDAVFDAAGKGVLADAIALAGGPRQVITLSDPAAADFGVTLSQATTDRAPGALDETIALLADGRLRLRAHTSMPMQQAAEAHRQLESGTVHERIILTLQ